MKRKEYIEKHIKICKSKAKTHGRKNGKRGARWAKWRCGVQHWKSHLKGFE